jgi:ribose/xylose/arabinose/galactoside ABC-type transport system permease subunit
MSSVEATSDKTLNAARSFGWQRIAEFMIPAAIILESIVFAVIAPQFFSVPNLINVALSIAIIGILAVGMTMVILTGGIDLSVGSIVALGGVTAALVAQAMGNAAGVWLGFAAAIGIGLIVGAFNGVMIGWFRVPPFVVTLALLTIGRGLAFIISQGRSIGDLPAQETFEILGRARPLGVPLPVILMFVVFAAGWFILTRTTLGRYIYAIGGNPEAAFLAGINLRRIKLAVYVLNGFLVGLAGATLASRLGAGVPNSGLQYELDVIAAVVVGGTSLNGGRGSVVGTLGGAIFIGVLNNGLNLAGIDPYMQKIALGVVILLAVLADQLNKMQGDVKM